MRAVLSGVIGGSIIAGCWLAAEHFTQSSLFWVVCFVGLVTGLAVRWGGSPSTRGSLLSGALAIVITLSLIVGGRLAYAKLLQSVIDPSAPALAGQASGPIGADEANAEDPGNAELETEPPIAEANRDATMNLGTPTKPSLRQGFSEWDMIWMSAAALLAYISARGGENPTADAASTDLAGDTQDSSVATAQGPDPREGQQ